MSGKSVDYRMIIDMVPVIFFFSELVFLSISRVESKIGTLLYSVYVTLGYNSIQVIIFNLG